MHTSASPARIDGRIALLLRFGADVVDDAGDHHGHGREPSISAPGLLELVEEHPQLDRVALTEARHRAFDEAALGERPVERGAVERAGAVLAFEFLGSHHLRR